MSDQEKSFIFTPELLRALIELQEWFAKRPDVTKRHFSAISFKAVLDGELEVTFYDDAMEIRSI